MAEVSGRNLTINNGPQHPAAQRVLVLLLSAMARAWSAREPICQPLWPALPRSHGNGTLRAHKKVLTRAYSKSLLRHICLTSGRPAEIQVEIADRSCTRMS